MFPFAYGLRDHPIFNTPRPIDRTRTIKRATPEDWRHVIDTPTIDVLPLVTDIERRWSPGWVSYDSTLNDAPDIEVFCGGINSKNNVGAALWREGHLMHFGFEQSPSEMNEIGRALLVNAIAYIARFAGDQAICHARSPFAGGSARARSSLEGYLKNEAYPLDFFTDAIAADALEGVNRTRVELSRWLAANRTYLRPGERGLLTLDREAKELALAYDSIAMFDRAIAILREGGDRAHDAAAVLGRYAPDGPGAAAGADAWQAWLEANRPYLFYSDFCGYRWWVDPLAKQRKIPSASLRGPARAASE